MAFLTSTRLRIYPLIFLSFYLVAGGVNLTGGLVKSPGLTDLQGKPVGSDFITFWAGAVLALEGKPAAVYQPGAINSLVTRTTGAVLDYPWHYPPTFLLLVSPLGLMPYLVALALWLGLTLAAYLLVVHGFAPQPLTYRLTLAFPGVFQNFFQGQNGFLTAALAGGGLLLLERRPWLAGALLGLVAYKPQFSLLIPVALLAGGYFRALAGAAFSALGLAALSLLAFGPDTWSAFFHNLPYARQVLETGQVPWFKMPTTFVAVRLLGGSADAARLLQGVMSVGAALAVGWVWRRNPPLPLKAAALALGMLLATPFAFDYDLTLLALPLACLGWEAYQRGWRRGEELLICLAYLTPFWAPAAARHLGLMLAPLVLAGLMLLALRRVREERLMPSTAREILA